MPGTASSSSVYPLRLEADIEPQLNRWLWLVKWFLLIPHFICLLFLWITLILAAIAAFFVLLVHRPLPAWAFRLERSACCAGRGGSLSTGTARSAPTGTRRSR